MLRLHCSGRAFSSCGEQGLLCVAVCRLLAVVVFLVVGNGLQRTGTAAVAQRLLCSVAGGIFPDQGSNLRPCIGRQILSHWSVAETSHRDTKQHTQRVGELTFMMPAGPEQLTLQALGPKQRCYRVFTGRLRQATLAANRLV